VRGITIASHPKWGGQKGDQIMPNIRRVASALFVVLLFLVVGVSATEDGALGKLEELQRATPVPP
jgi:hypothetical protein